MNSNNNQYDSQVSTVIKKRGRKSKKDLENKNIGIQNNINTNLLNSQESINSQDSINLHDPVNSHDPVNNNENIIVNIEDNDLDLNDENDNVNNFNDTLTDQMITKNSIIDNKPVAKKRGRKPKGGKIIQQILPLNENKENRPNVILHLKCFLKDLNDNNLFGSQFDSFNFSNANLSYDLIKSESNNSFNKTIKPVEEYECESDCENDNNCKNNNDIKEIWRKLKVLERDLHLNNISNKKCACFHDTCDFDNPPIHIPKHYINGTYHVYGCFCSPECAVAYLMKEPIDTSTKFERYYLLNNIYSKIFEYKKNIKPAADPFYMLDKFYGNLTIQEYRSLLRNERLFLIVDKPLTRIMPELHEDNDDFIINNKIIPSNTYQIKKRMQKKQTKNNILNERFGLVQ